MRHVKIYLYSVLSVVVLSAPLTPTLTAQDAGPATDSPASIPNPNPEDVESIDAIITALYDVISGPASEERDWDRFRSLFVQDARLVPTAVRPSGEVTLASMTPDMYAERASVFFQQPGGFFEVEIGRKVDRFGNIAQVFSSYASYREDEEDPFMRGINSIQLIDMGDRWAIVSILWDSERPDSPIPDEYLDATDSE